MDLENFTYPKGLRVLVVDDNLTCLKILERILEQCSYIVSIATHAVSALKMLKANNGQYDVVLSDVHMPEMDGFDLLENIGFELDIPVIMLSANDDPKQVLRGVTHGAVDYLLKPIRIEELKNIWQHVVRRKHFTIQRGRAINESETEKKTIVHVTIENEDGNSNAEGSSLSKKRKEQQNNNSESDAAYGEEELDGFDANGEREHSSSQKKPRVVWSPELHRKFVYAVEQLGPDKAFPKRILDMMDVEGLTRENVASHLQKYRLYLKRMSSGSPSDSTTLGARDPPTIFSSNEHLLKTYGAFSSYGNSQAGSSTAPYQPVSLLGQFNPATSYQTTANPMTQTSNNFGIGSSSGSQQVMEGLPHNTGTPCLSDYSRRMESWNTGVNLNPRPLPQTQTQTQSPNLFTNADMAQLQFALENSFATDTPNQNPLPAQNANYNVMQPDAWQQHLIGSTNSSTAFNSNLMAPAQVIGSPEFNNIVADPSMGQAISGEPSSFMLEAEMQDSNISALMGVMGLEDDSYLFEETNLLGGLIDDGDTGNLQDIVNKFHKAP